MGRNYRRKGRYRGKNRSKGIQWYWLMLGFGAYLVFMILEYRPELQPMRDTLLWQLIGKAIPSGILLYFAWGARNQPPRPGQIIMTLMAAVFWQGVIIPSNRLILLHITVLVFVGTGYLLYLMIKKKKNNEPLMFATMFFAVMMLEFSKDYVYVDGNDMRHWQLSLVLALVAGGAACYLILNGFIRLKDDRMSEKVCWCILAFFAAFMLLWSTANNLNYMLDFTLPEQYQMPIVEKYTDTTNKDVDYEITVEYMQRKLKFAVSQSVYFRYEVGDTLPVELYRGFFGDPYYIAE